MAAYSLRGYLTQQAQVFAPVNTSSAVGAQHPLNIGTQLKYVCPWCMF